ncbi:MAG: DUF2069 domain-containing protein [Aquabacterium sp.]
MADAPLPAAMRGHDAPTAVALSATLAAVTLLALIALGLAWELWLDRTGQGTLALKVLPLLLPLPGLLKRRLYTYRWCSLLVWLPITEGLVRGGSSDGTAALLAWSQVALGALLFAACVAHIRARLRAAPRNHGEPKR